MSSTHDHDARRITDTSPDDREQPPLDTDRVPDATVPNIEQTFDTAAGSPSDHPETAPTHVEGSHDTDERTQNRRLTLLPGQGRRQPSVPSGAFPVSTTFPVVRDALRHDEPLKRYQPVSTVAPLWSATATWADLTTQQAVPMLPDLPDGWGRKWTLTYRHGLHDLTASVASASTRDLLSADPVRVNSWHPKKTSRAGLRYMHSTDRHHAHESLFERKLLCALDFANADEVVSQPFTLSWHDGSRVRHHTPDFMAMVEGRITVINTRPAELLNERLVDNASALAEVCLSRGWGHALVTGYRLPAFTTVETVETHARDHDRLGYGDDMVDLLDSIGPTPFINLCHHFDGYIFARAILQRLIWERRVSVNLSTNLEDHSLVALPGAEVTS